MYGGERRTIAAIIELDEDFSKDSGPGEYLESEFRCLNKNGMVLKEWLIVDHDDESRWARYINYLIYWALDHVSEEFEGMSPACYDEWCDCEGEV